MADSQGDKNDPVDSSRQQYPEFPGSGGQQAYPDPQSYDQPQYGETQYGQGPYGQAPYGQGLYGQRPPGFVSSRDTNPLAVAALVLSLIGLTFAPLLASVGAVVCGHIARKQIRRTGDSGSGMALAGLVIGYAAIALVVVAVVLFLVFAVAVSAT